jgi:hypothetical protein
VNCPKPNLLRPPRDFILLRRPLLASVDLFSN